MELLHQGQIPESGLSSSWFTALSLSGWVRKINFAWNLIYVPWDDDFLPKQSPALSLRMFPRVLCPYSGDAVRSSWDDGGGFSCWGCFRHFLDVKAPASRIPFAIFRGPESGNGKWQMDEGGAAAAGGNVTLPAGCDNVVRCPTRLRTLLTHICDQHGKK